MGWLSGIFGGGNKQNVSQTTKNETIVNTGVEVQNDFIIDTDPIAQAFDGIKQTLAEIGILGLFSKEQEIKSNAETELLKGIIESENNKLIASGLMQNIIAIAKNAGIFLGVLFGIWAILKIIKG
jgi:hypothetical protein